MNSISGKRIYVLVDLQQTGVRYFGIWHITALAPLNIICYVFEGK
jgi:hypothetical protein